MEQLGLRYNYKEPSINKLNHYYWINQARLGIERRYPQAIWRGERELIPQGARGQLRHYVDAEVVRDGATAGLEVELSWKKPGERVAILSQLVAEYGTVWYFAAEKVRPALEEGIALLPEDQRKRIRVYDLANVAAE